ncbi:FtsB family cell division protein [Streptomyces profundus]|uniref:FtsB family cell division protein n=1 Tax=Streptomyces profundus TaxID=2867410 RepID=UPI001D16BE0E|nr:septum formation initiator family protein [Streptomyces sp. MA3_2.13]UED85942.1 septum formation initiator family protein [Streptomyces sp. MA3_2.13]
MAAQRDRFSTATRLRALGEQAAARVYRAQSRRLAGPRQPGGPPRRNRLTGRAALLALVVCSLVVALAYPLRQYVQQRSEIADQRRQAEEAADRVEELRDAKARWQDDAYVERQARERLRYVRPGEIGYLLPDESGGESDERLRTRGSSAPRPWHQNLWDGIDRADQPR